MTHTETTAGPIEQAVIDSIAARGDRITDADNACVLLARRIAEQMDQIGENQPTKITGMGSYLLKVLERLGCTPASRAMIDRRVQKTEKIAEAAAAKTQAGGSVLAQMKLVSGGN